MLVNIFNVYFTPQMAKVLLLGLLSGLPLALTGSTLGIWLTEEGISKASIGFFAAVGTPYALKFLWAPLVDHFPLPLISKIGRRRSWLLLSQMIMVVALLAMSVVGPVEHTVLFALLALVVATASATQDIVIDAYRVELLETTEQGAGAATSVLGYRIGMLLSGAGALFMAEYFAWGVVYQVMAAIVVLGGVVLLMRPEPKSVSRIKRGTVWQKTMRAVVGPMRNFMEHSGWWMILLFVMFFKLGDALAGVMTGPFLIELGFSKISIATIVKTYGLGATLLGTIIGGVLIARMSMLPALWLTGIFQMFSNLAFLLLTHYGADATVLTIVITIENLSGGMGTAAFVAYLSSLCRVQYTATQYALLSSLASAGRTWLSASSGVLAQSFGWPLFFIATAFAALPGFVLLIMLKKHAKP